MNGSKRNQAGGAARRLARLATATAIAAALAGCNMLTRLSEVGDGPQLTRITNPVSRPDYRPVTMPMPAPQVVEDNPNSLWRAGARAFFKDHRAKEVGDILTVKLTMDDSATWQNKTERTRDDSEATSVSAFLGLEAELAKKFPQAIDPTDLFRFSNDHETEGDGQITRSETLTLTFAATIVQILPNGNFVVMGRQEVRLAYEMRELLVTGVIRPSDIDADNTISHEKIAEMRVAYGGRGTLSDLQVPRWGTQVWDILFPF